MYNFGFVQSRLLGMRADDVVGARYYLEDQVPPENVIFTPIRTLVSVSIGRLLRAKVLDADD